MMGIAAAHDAALGLGIQVFDDVLPDVAAYRAWALGQQFQTYQTGDETWRGIALTSDATLPSLIAARVPDAAAHMVFFRKSPAGQEEPNFIHSDEGMGTWTALLYLNPDPDPRDGTTFWCFTPSGAIQGTARDLDKNPSLWWPWRTVNARFGRLVIFDSLFFHSRAIQENYGAGDDARLVQVAFGTRR